MKISSKESSTEVRTNRTLALGCLLRTVSFNKTLEIILATPIDDCAKIKIPQCAVTLWLQNNACSMHQRHVKVQLRIFEVPN